MLGVKQSEFIMKMIVYKIFFSFAYLYQQLQFLKTVIFRLEFTLSF